MNIEIGPHHSKDVRSAERYGHSTVDYSNSPGRNLQFITDSPVSRRSRERSGRNYSRSKSYDNGIDSSDFEYFASDDRRMQRGGTPERRHAQRIMKSSESRMYSTDGGMSRDFESDNEGINRHDILHRRINEKSVDPYYEQESIRYTDNQNDSTGRGIQRNTLHSEKQNKLKPAPAVKTKSSKKLQSSGPEKHEAMKTTSYKKVYTTTEDRGDTLDKDWKPVKIQVTSPTGERRRFSGAVTQQSTESAMNIKNTSRSNGRQHYKVNDTDYFIEPTKNRQGVSSGRKSAEKKKSSSSYYIRPTRKKGLAKTTAEFFEDIFEDTFELFGCKSNKSKSLQNLSRSEYSVSSKQNSSLRYPDDHESNLKEKSVSSYHLTSENQTRNQNGNQGSIHKNHEQLYRDDNQACNEQREKRNYMNRREDISQSDRYLNIRRNDSYNRVHDSLSLDNRSQSRDRLHIIRPISRSGQYSHRAHFSPPTSPSSRIRNAQLTKKSYSCDDGLNRSSLSLFQSTKDLQGPDLGGTYLSSLKIERPHKFEQRESVSHVTSERFAQRPKEKPEFETVSKGLVTRVMHNLPQSTKSRYEPDRINSSDRHASSFTDRGHFTVSPLTSYTPLSYDQETQFVDGYQTHSISSPYSSRQVSISPSRQYNSYPRSNLSSTRAESTMTSNWQQSPEWEDDQSQLVFSNLPIVTSDLDSRNAYRRNQATSAMRESELRSDVHMKKDQVLNFYIFGQNKPEHVEERPMFKRATKAPPAMTPPTRRSASDEHHLMEYTIFHKQTQTPAQQQEKQDVIKTIERQTVQKKVGYGKPAITRPVQRPVPSTGRSEAYQTSFFMKPQISETRSFEMESNAPTPSVKEEITIPVYSMANKQSSFIAPPKSNYSETSRQIQEVNYRVKEPEEIPEEDEEEEVILETTSIEEKEQRIRMEIREDVEFSMLRTQGGTQEMIASEENGFKRSVEPWWIPDKFEAVVDRRKQKTTKVEQMESDGGFSLRREPQSLESSESMSHSQGKLQYGNQLQNSYGGFNKRMDSPGFREQNGRSLQISRQSTSPYDDECIVEQAVKTKSSSKKSTTEREATTKPPTYLGPEVTEVREIAVKPFVVENQQMTMSVDDADQGQPPGQPHRLRYNLHDRHLEPVSESDDLEDE